MNNTVTNKIKQFPQIFALGPQIALKQKWHYFHSWSINTTKLDIYVDNNNGNYICEVYTKLSA